MTVFIELYGRLRDAGVGSPVELALPDGAKASDALAALQKKLGPAAKGVALASESRVLAASDPVPDEGRLAALPPVSGG